MNDEETTAKRLHEALTPETSRKVSRLLAKAQRCFRLADTQTNLVADADRLEALGRSYLDQARRLLSGTDQ